MSPSLRRFLAFLSAAVLCAQPAVGTTVVPPTFRQLVAQAEFIVHAEVRGVRCEETVREGRSIIHTYVTIAVLKAIKGAAPATMELRLLGGAVGERRLEVAGVPKFAPGERCVLFIENNGRQFCPLVAIMHGRYHVERRASDGADVILRDNRVPLSTPEEVALPMAHAGTAGILARARTVGGMTLGEFESRIQAELADAQTR